MLIICYLMISTPYYTKILFESTSTIQYIPTSFVIVAVGMEYLKKYLEGDFCLALC